MWRDGGERFKAAAAVAVTWRGRPRLATRIRPFLPQDFNMQVRTLSIRRIMAFS